VACASARAQLAREQARAEALQAQLGVAAAEAAALDQRLQAQVGLAACINQGGIRP
jgi:hypothetical protein